MPVPGDLTLIKRWLKALNDQTFVLPLKYVLAGYAESDRREELWQTAVTTHLDAQHGAMAGYVLLNARLRDIPPLHAAIQASRGRRS